MINSTKLLHRAVSYNSSSGRWRRGTVAASATTATITPDQDSHKQAGEKEAEAQLITTHRDNEIGVLFR
ncbi:MAG: hypothetical protein ACJ79S_11410 [Gemmatimonadaceae bacterium]